MVALIKYKGDNGNTAFDVDIDARDLPARAEALEELSRPAADVHARAKRIPPGLVAQALKNEPFEDYPRAVCAYARVCGHGSEAKSRINRSYRHAVEGFLRRTFHSLTFIPEISFSIENIPEDSEQKALKAAGVKFQVEGQMRAQVRSLSEAYDGLRALRTAFGNVVEKDVFNIETVVPSRFLPELLMAAPVWFVRSKRQDGAVGDQDVHYFCDLVDSDRFAYLFQMYNYKLRSFDEFQGRDIMPLPILQLVGKVKNLFDFLVIATPYHDLASEAWRRWDNTYAQAGGTSWTRNIDPLLFGFLRQIPEFMFFLGRWSGTGMLPLVGDMIADTIDHINNNKELLINIRRSTRWYKEDDKNIDDWREFIRMVPCPALRPISEYKPGWDGLCRNGKREWINGNLRIIRSLNFRPTS